LREFFSKQTSVIRLKLNILAPPNFWAGYATVVTPFSRFMSQTSGNTGGQHDALKQSFHDANWREYAENKTSGMDALPTLCFNRCWGVS